MSLRNRFILPSAFFSLVLLVGCGSSNSPTPNAQGFTVANLSGTYVFSISGTDVNLTASTESPMAIVGTIVADGKGMITGGSVDINDADLGGTGVFLAQGVSATPYTVSGDGRGTGTLVTPAGTFGLDFVLTSNSHGLITRFDNAGSGSGTLDLQGSASQGALTSMAFSLSGADPNGAPLGAVGSVTLNGSGTVVAGTQDFNDDGTSAALADLPFGAGSSLVLSSSTAGTAQLNTTSLFPALTFDVWVIDSTHLKLIETDTLTGAVLSGDAFTQQSTFTAGQVVFTVGGVDLTQNPVAAGGFATTDVNGVISNGIEDFNNAGTTGTSNSVSGSCATFAGGRCQMDLTGFTNGSASNLQFAAYPSSGGVLLLEDDSQGFAQGAAYSQTATSFGTAGYGLNLTGVNACTGSDCEVDDIAQFNAGSPTSNPNMTGVLDENDVTSPNNPVGLSGLYTPDSPATGRGSVNVPNINTFVGTLVLEYYVVDASTAIFIEGDAQQVSVGLFELQASTPGALAAARSPMLIVHPAIRPHGAMRRK